MEYNAQPLLMCDIDGFVAVGMQNGFEGIASLCDEEKRYAILAELNYEVCVNAENREAALESVKASSSSSSPKTKTARAKRGKDDDDDERGRDYEVVETAVSEAQRDHPVVPPSRKHDFDYLMDLANIKNGGQRYAKSREPVPLVAHRRTRSEGRIRRPCPPFNDIDGLVAVGEPLGIAGRSSSMPLRERNGNSSIFEGGVVVCENRRGDDSRRSLGRKVLPTSIPDENSLAAPLIPPHKILPDIDGFFALGEISNSVNNAKRKTTTRGNTFDATPHSTSSLDSEKKNRSEPSLHANRSESSQLGEMPGNFSKTTTTQNASSRTANRPRRHTDAVRPSVLFSRRSRETFDIDSVLLLVGSDDDQRPNGVPKPLPGVRRDHRPDVDLVGGSSSVPSTTNNVQDIDEMMQLAAQRCPNVNNDESNLGDKSSGTTRRSLPKLAVQKDHHHSLSSSRAAPATAPPGKQPLHVEEVTSDPELQNDASKSRDVSSKTVPPGFSANTKAGAASSNAELDDLSRWGLRFGEAMRRRYSRSTTVDRTDSAKGPAHVASA